MPFAEDPAVLREKAEQRRQSKASRGRGRGKPLQENSVKGKPKGQGQGSSTVQARCSKEQHKSSRANHNRKAMAARKQAKGMF